MLKKTIDFASLEEAVDCYGRENLIPIDNLKYAITEAVKANVKQLRYIDHLQSLKLHP